MYRSDKEIEALAQQITLGMKEDLVWEICGEPDTSMSQFHRDVFENHYQSANWQLTIRLDTKISRVAGIELRPLTSKEKAAWEFRKRLWDIETRQGQELPEPLQEGGTVEEAEYELYTALCSTVGLFSFYTPGTTFDDLTRDEIFHIYHGNSRPLGDIHERVLEYPGLLEDFEQKNVRRARLEKRFQVQNGYQLLSERKESKVEDTSGYFILSRVGFSSDGKTALLYIEAASSCGYYVLFRCGKEKRGRGKWRMNSHSMAWVS